MAFVCSLVFPGLGQLYNEEVDHGFAIMGGTLISFGLAVYGAGMEDEEGDALFYGGSALASILYLYSIIEAVFNAEAITRESRIRKARLGKKTSSIYYDKDRDISIDINPKVSSTMAGIQVKILF